MSTSHNRGKVTLITMLSLVGAFALVSLFDIEYRGQVASVQATSTATTTVRVLNTPPLWTVTARELYASATTTPTNVGTSTVWTGTATDNNGESYYLLVCKVEGAPTWSAGLARYQCNGGAGNEWGKSATTASGAAATVSTTTTDVLATFAEKNNWYGYICDINLTPAESRCNLTMYNGLHEAGAASATSSPFIVNHAPTISSAFNSGAADPGDIVTWTAVATDTIDVIRGNESLQLFVCKADDFNPLLPGCGIGGTWATSTLVTNGTIATTSVLAIPTQDNVYDAYFFVVDTFGLEATGGSQGSNNTLQVNNVAPYIGGSGTFGLYNVSGSTTPNTVLVLTVPEGETQNFIAQFDVSDDNGCLNTSATNEVVSIDLNAFRSGIGTLAGTGCDGDDTDNANNCYQHTTTYWNPTCIRAPYDTCTAASPNVTWECTFPLWYIADPTDGTSKFPTEYWIASARAIDDGQEGVGPLTGAFGTSTTISEMQQFLSFRATGSPIAYGQWEPGTGNPQHPATTTVYAIGNTGLDQYLSGDPMCREYPNCTGALTNTIPIAYQHWSLVNTTLFWVGASTTASTSPTLVATIDINKTIATSTPASADTYWGIYVPGEITFAGDYIGRNYIDAIVSPQTEW